MALSARIRVVAGADGFQRSSMRASVRPQVDPGDILWLRDSTAVAESPASPLSFAFRPAASTVPTAGQPNVVDIEAHSYPAAALDFIPALDRRRCSAMDIATGTIIAGRSPSHRRTCDRQCAIECRPRRPVDGRDAVRLAYEGLRGAVGPRWFSQTELLNDLLPYCRNKGSPTSFASRAVAPIRTRAASKRAVVGWIQPADRATLDRQAHAARHQEAVLGHSSTRSGSSHPGQSLRNTRASEASAFHQTHSADGRGRSVAARVCTPVAIDFAQIAQAVSDSACIVSPGPESSSRFGSPVEIVLDIAPGH